MPTIKTEIYWISPAVPDSAALLQLLRLLFGERQLAKVGGVTS